MLGEGCDGRRGRRPRPRVPVRRRRARSPPRPRALAARLAAGPTRSLGLSKRLLNAQLRDRPRRTRSSSRARFQSLATTSPDLVEGMAAFQRASRPQLHRRVGPPLLSDARRQLARWRRGGSWVTSTARSRSSRAPGGASGGQRRCCSPPRARRSSSTTSAARRRAKAPTSARPSRSSTRSSPPAARPSPTTTTSRAGPAAKSIVDQAVDELGGLDVLVNNAGILRDKMSFNMDEAEWDAVIARPPQGPLRSRRSSRRSTGGPRARRPASRRTPRS